MTSSRNNTIILTEEDRQKFRRELIDFPALNAVIIGDCIEQLKRLPDRSMDLLITDPPYNLTKTYSTSIFNSTEISEYLKWFEEWLIETKRVMKSNASLYICNDWRATEIVTLLRKHFFVQNRITFEREKGRGSKTNWKNAHEDIWFCTMHKTDYYFDADSVKVKKNVIAPYTEAGKPKDWDATDSTRMTHASNFWDDITVPFWSMPENTLHPTQKSEKLVAKLILASSREGDAVLDVFGGSGTTAVVAKKLNRNFMIIEKEEEYCFYTLKRLELAEANRRIQGYENGIFYDRNFVKPKKNKTSNNQLF